ncbi:MAG: hypothetical protein NTZ46_02995 [Verrucomicrobia bacterium]|nr:hypothetical protein [Verrucomicrobiota bacterium]
MKIKTVLFTLILTVFLIAVLPRPAEARVTFSYFYDSLQPYGEWVDVDTYGYCWQPRGMDRDWRPYTDGYWAYTDAGWTWVSYEDFGPITYHYGRWIRLEDYGWVWKPDYRWGPAWVSWRQSDEYIGWAPLPPDVAFEPQIGIGVWVDRDYDIGPLAYSFCEYRSFGAPVMRNVLLPRHRNYAIINNTVNITNITITTGHDQNRVVFNGGLDYRRVSARSQNRIEMLQLTRRTDGDWARQHRPELSHRMGNQLVINAPEVEPPTKPFAPARVSQQIRAPKIDRGWTGLADPTQREKIQAHYHDETRGLTRTTAPAKPVDAAQVQSMMNEVRSRQQPAPMQVQQQQAQPQIPQLPQSQPVQVQQTPPGKKDRSHHKEQRSAPMQQTAPVQQMPPAQQMRTPQAATPAQTPTQIPQLPAGSKGHRRSDQQQQQTPPSTTQTAPQPQAIEQQRRTAEAEARAARDQQIQAQRAQQAQVQAEQQRKSAEAEARAARDQQMQAQRAQQAQVQAEQQRKAGEAEARAARDQQMQAQRAQQAQMQAEQQRRAEGQGHAHEGHSRKAPPQPAQAAPAQAQPTATPDAGDHKKHRD